MSLLLVLVLVILVGGTLVVLILAAVGARRTSYQPPGVPPQGGAFPGGSSFPTGGGFPPGGAFEPGAAFPGAGAIPPGAWAGAFPAGGAAPYQPGIAPLPPQVLAQVQALLAGGKEINAIKLVRQYTRMGLKDAKDYVEAMAAGGPAPAFPGAFPGAAPWAGPPGGGGTLSERVRALRTGGDPAAAVALVRAETGMGQAEAERFVDALD